MYVCSPNTLSVAGERMDASDYRVSSFPVLFDDVKCTGSESNLLSCPQLPLDSAHDCTHAEDIALKCDGEACVLTCTCVAIHVAVEGSQIHF